MGVFQKLPTDLIKNGFNYTQILRGNRSCIYEQMFPNSRVKYYEVFKKRIRPERTVFGTSSPASEIFPNDEAFGQWAWTFRDIKSAKWRFDELEAGKNSLEFTFPNSNRKKYDG